MRITLLGSGNVATHLAAAFKNAGHHIMQVYSRDIQHASLLAYHLKAEAIADIDQVNPNMDLFIIAVKDDVILTVAKQIAKHNILTVHTSGATELSAISAVIPNSGVFYPLQTFSKTKEVDFWSVPLCIEGSDEAVRKQLEDLARTISNNVYRIDSAQRKILHLAAVFACNFPNYLYDVARQLLQQYDMKFDLLKPLILETAQKVQDSLPADVQTGPAIRNDEQTMTVHLQLLADEPQLKLMYELLSQGIIKNSTQNTAPE